VIKYLALLTILQVSIFTQIIIIKIAIDKLQKTTADGSNRKSKKTSW